MRRLAAACALLTVASCTHLPRKPVRSTVVVTIVVDQLAAWIFDERHGLLPPDGGFARLLREGTYAREMQHAHAATDTAPGHAALYTGAPPRGSGIACNERLVGTGAHRRVSSLIDENSHRIDRKGVEAASSVSLVDLQAEPLADRLRSEHPAARVIALSLKDRGTIFAAGHHPDVALWWDHATDELVTATPFATALPAWAPPLMDEARARRGHAWERSAVTLPPDLVDDRPGEGRLPGGTRTFPHRIATPADFRASPDGDRLLFDLALAALDATPGGSPTLLALSLSSNDYVAHVYGCDSIEAYEELFALDRGLGRFLGELDRRYGTAGWSLVLAADHGATPLLETPREARPWCKPGAPPDRWQRPCEGGRRIDQDALGDALARTAEAALHRTGLIHGVSDPYVYFGDAARDPAVRAALVPLVVAALRATPGVADVYEVDKLPARCPPVADDSIAALVCRATSDPLVRTRNPSGDLFIVLDEASFFDAGHDLGRGGSHGTPYRFNRAVPLLVRAPGRAQAGLVLDQPIPFSSFTRTAAALLGIAPPARALPGMVLVR